MLTTASVVGREFEFRLLSSISGTAKENELLEALEEALGAQVLEELPDSAERYQFTHAPIQETLSSELSAARRVRLHARIGEAREELYGADAENHAAELAHHCTQAEPVLGPEKLVRDSWLAGEQALAGYAYEAAFTNFQQALAAKGVPLTGSAPAPDGEAEALLFGLGRAQVATLQRHQLGEAVTSLGRAFDYHVGQGDAERAITVPGTPLTTAPCTLTGVTGLVAQALPLVPQASLEAGNLLTRHGRAFGIEEGNYEGTHGALAIARHENDVSLEMWTLANAAQVEMYHLHNQESLEFSLRATELALKIGDIHGEVVARYWILLSLRNNGEIGQARKQAPAIFEPAERSRDRYWRVSVLDINLTLALVVGDWESARSFSDRAMVLAPLEPRNLLRRVETEVQAGSFEQGKVFIERFLEALRLTPPGPNLAYAYTACLFPHIARITGIVDQFDIAKEAANTVITSPTATPLGAMYARLGLALAAVQQNDKLAAAEQYEMAKIFRGNVVPALITADRVLGLLSHTMGDADRAAGHFEDGLNFCRRADYRPELAWTCHDYADCLLARNALGDRQRVMALLNECLDISTELGMRPLMEREAGLSPHIGSRLKPAPVWRPSCTIVVGYMANAVRGYFGSDYRGLSLSYVENTTYASTNNHFSLWLARVDFDDDVLLLESDLVFDDFLVMELLLMVEPNVAVVDRFRSHMGGTVILADGAVARSMVLKTDQGPGFDYGPALKTVNIYRLSKESLEDAIVPKLEEFLEDGRDDQFYEAVFANLIGAGRMNMAVINTGSYRWAEIDTLGDLSDAEKMFAAASAAVG